MEEKEKAINEFLNILSNPAEGEIKGAESFDCAGINLDEQLQKKIEEQHNSLKELFETLLSNTDDLTSTNDLISTDYLTSERLLTLAKNRGRPVSSLLMDFEKSINNLEKYSTKNVNFDLVCSVLFVKIKKEVKAWRCVFPDEESDDVRSTMNREINNAQSVIENANAAVDLIKKDTLSTVLTVLGIFVAVIIAVVAVYLNGVADENALSLPMRRQILLAAFRWHATFLLIFFLIFLIAKLTGRSLAGMCKDAEETYQSGETGKVNKSCDCSLCKKGCGKVKQIRKRFPWFVLMNGAFFAVELAALFVEIVGWSKIKDWLIIN